LKYISQPLVLWRNDNESFQNAGGLVNRFLLDFDGYLHLADKYLSNDLQAKKAFLKVMTREHPWYTIIHVTSLIDTPELWNKFRAKLLKFGYSRWMALSCYVLSRNRRVVFFAVKIKRNIVRRCKVI